MSSFAFLHPVGSPTPFFRCRVSGISEVCQYVITQHFPPVSLLIMLPNPSSISPFFYLQVIRSVSQWSAGTSQIEDSIHNAYYSLIEKAEHFIYIEVCSILFIL